MRPIGELRDRASAARFVDYLFTLDIGAEVHEQGGGWAVWVYDEDQVARAEQEFRAFAAQPDAPQYGVAAQAADLRRRKEREDAARQTRDVEMPPTWRAVPLWRDIPVSTALIAVSVGVTLVSQLGRDPAVVDSLFLTAAAFRKGELWRLVTPVFVHFGLLHILFNMMWLKRLGGMIEVLKGHGFYVFLLLVLALMSNLVQYLFAGPDFGGMSGVVYGLFGYIWVKSRREPWSGFYIDQTSALMMFGWFILCMTGRAGPIANWAHGAGLFSGMLLGLIPGKRR